MFSVVTGGAGFIGSHLVDALVARGDSVLVIDNLSTGERGNLAAHLDRGQVELLVADLLGDGWQERLAGAGGSTTSRPTRTSAAARPRRARCSSRAWSRRSASSRPCARRACPRIAFTSTSTVYGEATVIPTPEEYTPMVPISVYGAGTPPPRR